MAVRIFLAILAVVWLPYGLYCFANPGSLAELAGVGAGSTTGTIELRAMYGGLQSAVGVLALLAIWRAPLRHPTLVCVAFLCSGLALARLLGAILDAQVSPYTAGAIGLEVVLAAVASVLLRGAGTPANV